MSFRSRPVGESKFSNFRPKKKGRSKGGRRKGGKRSGRSSGISGAQIAGLLAAAGFRYLFNTEDKYLDTTASLTPDTTGATTLLNGLVQGTDVSTRLGDSIKIVNFSFNYSLTIAAAATTTFVRFLIIRDKQPDGAGPGFTTNVLMSASYNALYNPDYSMRYVVMFDNVFALDINGDQTLVGSRSNSATFHVRYGLGNAGTIADISTNSLYLCHISDQAVNKPNFQFNARLKYVDN